jgi:transcriptional regulator with XRE-family HTH domain
MAMKTLAERLVWARTRRTLSQSQLAHVAGVSQGTIANLENGVSLTARKIVAIAAALDVSSAWLAEGKGPVNGDEESARPEAQGHSLQWVTEAESLYLSLFRNLNPDGRDTVLSMLRVLQNTGASQDRAKQ